jgi:phosphoglycerate dehydrogenase-like enzyme
LYKYFQAVNLRVLLPIHLKKEHENMLNTIGVIGLGVMGSNIAKYG